MMRRVPSSANAAAPSTIQSPRGRAPAPDVPAAFGTGLVALDVIFSADRTRPPRVAAGGTCGNVLAILSFLGWDAFPIARLADDAVSDLVRADLARHRVALDFASQAPTAETPVIVQQNRIARNGTPEHRFSVTCPACGAWFPSFRAVTADSASLVMEAVADAAPSGFTPRVFFFDRVSRGALLLARFFADRGALVVFEPVGVGDPRLFAEALATTHVLKYSHERLPELADRRTTASRPLLELETRGEDGLRYRSPLLPTRAWRRHGAVPASPVVDTAGAGDWCTAVLLSALAAGGVAGFVDTCQRHVSDAVRYAQAAAAIACTYEGARGAADALGRDAFVRVATRLLAGENPPVGDAPPRAPSAAQVAYRPAHAVDPSADGLASRARALGPPLCTACA